MKNALVRFIRDEQGATAIEYGLIAGLIAMGMVAGATTLGSNLSSAFSNLGAKILALLPAA
ncbi:Flp family type IVb pilin [Cupriavidus basilensis]|uniref:Flp family type IVb pilin n=1 Tax=Cupriavidus basilensis TaxID=68895 RepID=A0ABT6AWI9_9BURK|nr:Flp family type IVb pilin [Cupriavidus basilensis]MDF3837001.1 Flp family type IVb pilin [Cupriavidus basilensis]